MKKIITCTILLIWLGVVGCGGSKSTSHSMQPPAKAKIQKTEFYLQCYDKKLEFVQRKDVQYQSSAKTKKTKSGLKIYGGAWTNGKNKGKGYDGNGILSNGNCNFTNSELRIKFSVHANNTYASYHLYPKGFKDSYAYTTHNTWAKSKKIAEDKNLYQTLRFYEGGNWELNLSTENYTGLKGSKTVYENKGQLTNTEKEALTKSSVIISFGDNYAGTKTTLSLKEVVVKKINHSPLAYTKGKKVYEVNLETINKILAIKDIKKPSRENNILILLDTLGLKSSLNLKDIKHEVPCSYSNAKQTKDEILVFGTAGTEYNDLFFGYILHFNKTTLDLSKIHCFHQSRVHDISKDMKTVLVNNLKKLYPKNGGLVFENNIATYNFATKTFSEMFKKTGDLESLTFSPLETYIVLNTDSGFEVYDLKRQRSIFDRSTKAEKISFSPDEKFFAHGDARTTILYDTLTFQERTRFNKEGGSTPEHFILSNNYLVLAGISKLYHLESGEIIKIPYIGYANPFVTDGHGFYYVINRDTVEIYYIKNNTIYFIKDIPTAGDISIGKVLFVKNKLLLFPRFSGDKKFAAIDISDITNYNFELADQLKQANKFYEAGFKDKSFSLYKAIINDPQFDEYFEQSNRDDLNGFIYLEKYKTNKDIESLVSYIFTALNLSYIDEAKKAIAELKTVSNNNKDLYTIAQAAYLAQIDKQEASATLLVNNMPFSQTVQKIILKHNIPTNNLSLYKDKAKLSLFFDIDKAKIKYSKDKIMADFVSFEGRAMKSQKEKATTETPQQNKENEAIELLD